MEEIIEKQFDAYIKRTIKNTVINVKKQEIRKQTKEVSIETLQEGIDTSFSFEPHLEQELEDYFEDERISKIIKKLKPCKKEILKLRILERYSSKEIGKIMNKKDSSVRHIYSDTIKQIKERLK